MKIDSIANENTPRSPSSHFNPNPALSREDSNIEVASSVSSGSGTKHTHWCTVCRQRVGETCDGWKRHEKQKHENSYACMPNGPIERTNRGPRCAFCDLFNPDQRHLDLHAVELCIHKPGKERKFSRKYQLERHLEIHGISDTSTLADRWQIKLNKKFHSCGFCVSLFSSFSERLTHIDNFHYRCFKSIDEWDPNMVIRGLLLQPGVLASWEEQCAWDSRKPTLIWRPETIASLQLRLELSEEPARQLAGDAFYFQQSLLPLLMTEIRDRRGFVAQDALDGHSHDTSLHATLPGLVSHPNNLSSSSAHGLASSLPSEIAGSDARINSMNVHPPTTSHNFHGLDPTVAEAYNRDLELLGVYTDDSVPSRPQASVQYSHPSSLPSSAQNITPSHQSNPSNSDAWQPSPSYANTSMSSASIPVPRNPVAGREKNRRPGRRAPASSIHHGSTAIPSPGAGPTSREKSPSFVAQLRRTFSRHKMDVDMDRTT